MKRIARKATRPGTRLGLNIRLDDDVIAIIRFNPKRRAYSVTMEMPAGTQRQVLPSTERQRITTLDKAIARARAAVPQFLATCKEAGNGNQER